MVFHFQFFSFIFNFKGFLCNDQVHSATIYSWDLWHGSSYAWYKNVFQLILLCFTLQICQPPRFVMLLLLNIPQNLQLFNRRMQFQVILSRICKPPGILWQVGTQRAHILLVLIPLPTSLATSMKISSPTSNVTTTPSLDSARIVQFPKICCTSLIRLYHVHKANHYTLSMNVELEFRSVMSIKFSILHLLLTLFRFSMSCPVLCQMFSLVHLVWGIVFTCFSPCCKPTTGIRTIISMKMSLLACTTWRSDLQQQ